MSISMIQALAAQPDQSLHDKNPAWAWFLCVQRMGQLPAQAVATPLTGSKTPAAEGLVPVESAPGDRQVAVVVDGAAFGDAGVGPRPAIAADGLIAADCALLDGGGRAVDIEAAAVGPAVGRVVASPCQVVADGAGGD